MSEPFLIVGLPRSRTAWWSVVTTTPQSICWHEPLKNCNSFGDLAALWADQRLDYVGISDSGLAYQLPRIMAEIAPRTLIVERSQDAVERSLVAFLGDVPCDRAKLRAILQQMSERLAKYRKHRLVKVVAFDELNDPDVVEACFAWLMPYNPHRFNRALMGKNIQTDRGRFLEAIRKPNSGWFLED